MHVLTGSPCPHPFVAAACPLCRGAEAPGRTTPPVAAADLAQFLAQLPPGSRRVLRDGDVLARPEALELIAAARRGAGEVEVWTSGVALARPGVAEAVLRAGATTVAMPLYGDAAESHDWLTGQPGHFQRVIAAFKRVRALGGKTAVVAPILRPTFRALPALVQKSQALQISQFHFVALPGPDRAAQPLLPSLEMAAPYLRQALQMVQAAKRSATVLDVPPCLLLDQASRAALAQPEECAPTGATAPAREQGPPCTACTWRAGCAGLPAATAQRFGWAGLVARSDPPPTAKPLK